jgi:hypothetical protein
MGAADGMAANVEMFDEPLAIGARAGIMHAVRSESMSKQTITRNLKRVLLDDAPFALALFDYELREHVEEYLASKHADDDRYFFAVTEHTNDVAMLLIDEHDTVHINEDARAALRTLWGDAYAQNLKRLIPKMMQDLTAGYLFAVGVKVVASSSDAG